MNEQDFLIQIKADNAQLNIKLKESEALLRKFGANTTGSFGASLSGQFKSISNEAGGFLTRMTGISPALLGAGAVAATAGAAFVGLGAALKVGVEEARDAERNYRRLSQVVESTGGAAGMTVEELIKLSDALQLSTKFTDDQIQEAESLLLTFTNIGKDVFPMATEAVLDMATMMGGDLKSASIQIGKALQDPIQGVTALKKVGVQLNDTQTQQIKNFMKLGDVASAQKLILAELNTEMGGQARAALEPYDRMVKTFQDGAQVAGQELTPALDNLYNSLADVIGPGTVFNSVLINIAKGAREVVNGLAMSIRYIQILWKNDDAEDVLDDIKRNVDHYKQLRKVQIDYEKGILSERDLQNKYGLSRKDLYDSIKESKAEYELLQKKYAVASGEIQDSIKGMDELDARIKGLNNEVAKPKTVFKQKKVTVDSGDDEKKLAEAYNKLLESYLNERHTKEFTKNEELHAKLLENKRVYLANQEAIEREYAERKILAQAADAERERKQKEELLLANVGLKSQEASAISQIMDNLSTLMQAKDKRLFYVGKAASIARAVINIAEGVTKAFSYGPVLGPLLAGSVIAAGAVQIKTIASQKYEGSSSSASTASASSTDSTSTTTDASTDSKSSKAIDITNYNVKKFASGVFNVPSDMYSLIHKGESVITRPITESIKRGDITLGAGSMRGTTEPSVNIHVQGSIIDTQGLLQAVNAGRSRIARNAGATDFYSRSVYH